MKNIGITTLSILAITLSLATPLLSQDDPAGALVKSEENLDKTDDKLKELERQLMNELGSAPEKIKQVKAENKPLEKSPPTTATTAKIVDDSELINSQKRSKNLARELEITKLSLRSAEKKIDELSNLVRESYNRNEFSRDPIDTRASQKPLTSNPLPEKKVIDQSSDHTYVMAAQTPLRVGPSRLDSALFLLPRGSRLKIERRTGEWYRIVTENGIRGWIFGGAIAFLPSENPDSTLQIRAFNAKYEAFRSR